MKGRIYRNDCTFCLEGFPADCFDLIVTSPPYADRRAHSYGGVSPDKYVEWFLPIAKQLYKVLKPDGSFVLNIKEGAKDGEKQTYVIELILALRKQGWRWVEEYIWYKKNSYPGKWKNRFRNAWERCLHFTKQKDFKMYQDAVKVPIGSWTKQRFKSMSKNDFIRSVPATDSKMGRKVSSWLGKKDVYPHNVVVFEEEHYVNPSNVLMFPTECGNKKHSAVFPLELPTWFIKLFTQEGDIVLDPFVGIGTTVLAAIALGRGGIGIEISEEFCKEARKNIEKLENA